MKRLFPVALLALVAGCNSQTSVLVLVDGPALSALKVDVALASGSGIEKELPGPLTPAVARDHLSARRADDRRHDAHRH